MKRSEVGLRMAALLSCATGALLNTVPTRIAHTPHRESMTSMPELPFCIAPIRAWPPLLIGASHAISSREIWAHCNFSVTWGVLPRILTYMRWPIAVDALRILPHNGLGMAILPILLGAEDLEGVKGTCNLSRHFLALVISDSIFEDELQGISHWVPFGYGHRGAQMEARGIIVLGSQ